MAAMNYSAILLGSLVLLFCARSNAQDSVDTLLRIHKKSIAKNQPNLDYEPITRDEFLQALKKWTQEDHPDVSPRNSLVVTELLETHRMIFPVGIRLRTDWVVGRTKHYGVRVEFFASDKKQRINILIREKISSSRKLMSNELENGKKK